MMNIKMPFYKKLKKIILDKIVNIPQNHLDEIYSFWYADKNNKDSKFYFVYPEKNINKNQKIPSTAIKKGIDLPSWFGDISNTKVVLLGLDPLRNKKSFLNESFDLLKKKLRTSNIKSDVIIGTPYSFQSFDERVGASSAYWTFVEGIMRKGNFIYCTDIYKTYYHNDFTGKRSYNDINKEKQQSFRSDLIKELEIINPDIILVMGGKAHKLLLDKPLPKISQDILNTKRTISIKGKETDVFTFMHLSKGTRDKNIIEFLEANSIINTKPSDRKSVANDYIDILNNNNII